ncbi:NADH-quinone oxidoreductase subunit L [Carboxydochorda subterranea]|uniref:NADH-quinone oxidoreductase subunit L n=1 Tax=Carboxydichorda subterranea TaxID=3109565 RepID=A0ABZ1C030_9FIRM|nr:NADH-quinone oxidoreductase subunit L [Limnochorda sp. L945t]WRP18200.1 NADH-quinone oxidoreductase subunit L [Limnochorda sp. L945t]
MLTSPWLAAIVAFPLAGALVLALAGRRWSRRAVAWVANGAVALAFASAVVALVGYLSHGSPPEHVPLVWRIGEWWTGTGPAVAGGTPADRLGLGLLGDGLSLWFVLIVTGVGLLIHIYSVGYMAEDPSFGRYFAELNYFIFAMSLLVLADGLLPMLIGWANVGLASYLLIGFWHQRADARAASIKAFLVTLGGEIAIVVASAWLWDQTGALDFVTLFQRLGGVPQETLTAIGLLLLWGAAAKSAQLPLHVWLPDAMAGPTPVSALIHAATMVTAGVYLTARMYPVYAAAPAASQAVAWVGALSALFGALVACGQTDIKRILAYSTMSQIGYMFLGVGLQAQMAGVFHFFTQAFFKALLFLAAGLVIHYLGGEQDVRRMGGLAGRLRLAYVAYGVGALAMAGIPPFSGYFSKEAILEQAWEQGAVWLWALAVAAAGLTAFYSGRMVALIFTGPQGSAVRARVGRPAHHEPGATTRAMAVPVAILAALAAVAGWVWIPGRVEWAPAVLGSVFRGLQEGAGASGVQPAAEVAAHGVPAAVAWLPVLVALASGGAGLWVYGPGRGAAGSRPRAPAWVAAAWAAGLYVDAAYARVIVRPALAVSRWAESVVETEGVDGSVNGVAALAALVSRWLGRLQSGFVRRYALAVLAGAAVVVIWVVAGL